MQGAGVGGGHDAADALIGEGVGGGFGLLVAEGGELGVGDSRVLAGGGEVEVELALSVAEEDHAADLAHVAAVWTEWAKRCILRAAPWRREG